MRRFAFALLVVAASASQVRGQVLIALLFGDKLQTETFEFGIRAGVNGTTLSGLNNVTLKPGLAFGMYGTKFLSERFAIQPEAAFLAPRGGRDLDFNRSGFAPIDSLLEGKTATRSLAYVEIPIIAKYYITEKISIGAGPQVGWLRSGSDRVVATLTNGDEITRTTDVRDAHNKWDYGLTFGLDYRLGKRKMHFTARGYYGATDLLKDNPGETVRNTGFNFSIGIPVGGAPEEKDEEN